MMTDNNSGTTINQYIQEIATPGSFFDDAMMTILGKQQHHKGALISEVCLYLLENKDKMWNAIKQGYFNYLFIRMCKNQVHSKTSPFHFINRHTQSDYIFDFEVQDEDDITNKLNMEHKYEQIEAARLSAGLSWYENEMLELYYNSDMTYRQIEEEYNIPHVSVFLTVKQAREKIQKQINQKYI